MYDSAGDSVPHKGAKQAASAALSHLNDDPKRISPNSTTRQYKMTRDEFIRETSLAERQALASELCGAVLRFLENDSAVFLEGVGIIIPRVFKENKVYLLDDKHVIRSETTRTVDFEKCAELIAFNRERFPNLMETKDLVQRIYPRLPLSLQIRWSEKETQRLLRGLLQMVRYDAIVKGHTSALEGVGELYALHNRQGASLNDWFAGADLFMRPQYHQSLAVGPSNVSKRPVLESAWELLEAAYGRPVAKITLDLERELAALGYDVSNLSQYVPAHELKIPVGVFQMNSGAKSNETVTVYCTEGLRSHGQKDDSAAGTGHELVFQLHLDSSGTAQADYMPLTRWACRPLALAWLLLRNCKGNKSRHGLRLSSDVPLFEGCESQLSWVITTEFKSIRTPQICKDGTFSFLNVACIADDEARVADIYSAEHLLTLLEYKRLAQVTKPTRSSVVARTGIMTDKRLHPAQRAPLPGDTSSEIYAGPNKDSASAHEG